MGARTSSSFLEEGSRLLYNRMSWAGLIGLMLLMTQAGYRRFGVLKRICSEADGIGYVAPAYLSEICIESSVRTMSEELCD